jgi:hypothetical protein
MFSIGDIVDRKSRQGIVVKHLDESNILVCFIETKSMLCAHADELRLLQKASYTPIIGLGDKVIDGTGEEGIVFAVNLELGLPYLVGFSDGSTGEFNAVELIISRKASYA